MKWNKIISYLIVAAATVAITLLIANRHKPAPVVLPAIDSIKVNLEQARMIDSLITDNNKRSSGYDSVVKASRMQSQELKAKNSNVKELTVRASLYRSFKDSAAFYKLAADTLLPRIEELTTAVDDYQQTNTELYYQLDTLKKKQAETEWFLIKKAILYSQLQLKVDSLAGLTAVPQTQKPRKPLRWGIGPQVGATYDGKVKAYGGAGITYSLIRF